MAKIVITIPTWNESRIIARTVHVVREAAREHLAGHEVLIEVADNASTDGTADLAERAGASVLRLSEKGKGLAIRRSWARHLDDADILIFTDADLAADLSVLGTLVLPVGYSLGEPAPGTSLQVSTPPGVCPKPLGVISGIPARTEVHSLSETYPEPARKVNVPPAELISSATAQLACGSRFVAGAVCKRRMSRELASRMYWLLQRVLLGLPVRDAHCGLKAITTDSARQILPLCHEDGWMFDSELLAIAHKKTLKITEIPVHWVEHRDPGRRSSIRLLRDGFGFLQGLAKIRRRMRQMKG